MRHNQYNTWITCDRCGKEIDDYKLNPFFFTKRFRVTSASYREFAKDGYMLTDSAIPLPENDVVSIEGVIGYKPDSKTLDLCDDCGKEFKKIMKKFMKNK